MKLVYFENENHSTIAIAASQIVGIQQNRLPTETPTTVMLTTGSYIRVRNSFDDCQQKLIALTEVK